DELLDGRQAEELPLCGRGPELGPSDTAKRPANRRTQLHTLAAKTGYRQRLLRRDVDRSDHADGLRVRGPAVPVADDGPVGVRVAVDQRDLGGSSRVRVPQV